MRKAVVIAPKMLRDLMNGDFFIFTADSVDKKKKKVPLYRMVWICNPQSGFIQNVKSGGTVEINALEVKIGKKCPVILIDA